MINLHSFIRDAKFYKKLIIDDLLFVEYKCLVEETKAGIWSEVNYFVFVTSGKKMWKSIHKDYVVQTGDSLFVKKGANLVHQYFDEDYCALMVFISDDFICKFMTRFTNLMQRKADGLNRTDSVIRILMDEFLAGYVHSMASFFGTDAVPNKNLLVHKFEELLLNIFTRPLHRDVAGYLNSLNSSQSAQVEQIMEENFSYRLKLDQFAQLCNMSLSSFKRTFSSIYNTSPAKWLSEKRLDFASHLLNASDRSINQVAFDSGFEDTSSFIRAFKQKYSCTPLQYRNSPA